MATNNDFTRAKAVLEYLEPGEAAEVLHKNGMSTEDAVFSVCAAMILLKAEKKEEKTMT